MTVPDEAIEAAHRAVLEYKSTRGIDNQRNAMRAALEAAAPYLRAETAAAALDGLKVCAPSDTDAISFMSGFAEAARAAAERGPDV